MVGSHEDAGAASLGGAFLAEANDLLTVNLIILEGGELHLALLVLDLFGLAEHLLFALLGTATKAEHEVKSGLLLDIVVGKGAAVLELLAREDEALLVWRDALFVLDFALHILYRVAALYLQRDGLPRQRLDEYLHCPQRLRPFSSSAPLHLASSSAAVFGWRRIVALLTSSCFTPERRTFSSISLILAIYLNLLPSRPPSPQRTLRGQKRLPRASSNFQYPRELRLRTFRFHEAGGLLHIRGEKHWSTCERTV